MAQKKKLQVFVSSTYTDLVEERQAAVEAILRAGHIPAGMELFAAGDETQMNVIRRWIDEADVYMLILGGRYGSIDPKSGMGYIELEYRYALEINKPVFAVVIDEDYLNKKVKRYGSNVIETAHPDKLKKFRDLVRSKMVRFWRDPTDIKIAILETMTAFSDRPDILGWIPSNEGTNVGAIAEELSRLYKENKILRDENRLLREGRTNDVIHVRQESHQQLNVRKEKRNRIFYSYSHNDNKWLDRLLLMLNPLIQSQQIIAWADTKIKPGEQWRDEIQAAIESADIAVLLVSPHFLASDFILKNELPPLLSAAKKKGLVVFWIAIDHSLFDHTEIANYQAANDPSKPLSALKGDKLNKEILEISRKIIAALSQE